MKLVVMIPAFNEEKTIAQVIDEVPKKIEGIDSIQVIVIDDGSTDSTPEIAKSKKVIVLKNPGNRGLAYSFSRGIDEALAMKVDIIVNTDADFQYDQRQIPRLIEPILKNKADIVLGSRFMGKIEEMPFSKYWGNKAMSMMVSLLTGLKITDAQTGFRAFSREACLRLNVFSGYTYTQETILSAWENRLRILEVPADFRKREGKSRLISNIFDYAYKAGFTVIQTYLIYKPLRVFLSIGALLLLAGLVTGFKVLMHYFETGMVSPYLPTALLSSLLFILGVQFVMIGFVADMVKRNRVVNEKVLYETKKRNFG